MSNPVSSKDGLPAQSSNAQNSELHGSQLPIEQSDNECWQPVQLPGTIAGDQIPGLTFSYLQTNAMDSSSTPQTNGTTPEPLTSDINSQRETELLDLVRDLNECNDVLLAKVSQLEESLERSQTALQAEIDRSGLANSDRNVVQLVTELEQSNQALQHHQMLNETLQTELTASRERTRQLETEYATLLQQNTEQSQELLQSSTNCRDLRARLQRQQRYTLQFKVALEKCLSMSSETANTAAASNTPGITMPKVDEIRPWESAMGNTQLDPQLASMIRGGQQTTNQSATPSDTEAEDQLWHDLARVMGPEDANAATPHSNLAADKNSPQFTEPSPWVQSSNALDTASEQHPDDDTTSTSPQLSPEASEILARVQSAKITADTYLPAMSAQSTPSPVVNPLKPQKRIGSLSAIDLPNFPRLKKQSPTANA